MFFNLRYGYKEPLLQLWNGGGFIPVQNYSTSWVNYKDHHIQPICGQNRTTQKSNHISESVLHMLLEVWQSNYWYYLKLLLKESGLTLFSSHNSVLQLQFGCFICNFPLGKGVEKKAQAKAVLRHNIVMRVFDLKVHSKTQSNCTDNISRKREEELKYLSAKWNL